MVFLLMELFEQDKRVFERLPVELSLRVRDTATNSWQLLKVKDMSAGGVGVVAEKELTPDNALEMWFPIPGRGEDYYATGRVAWTKKTGERCHAGLAFEKTDLVGLSVFLSSVWAKSRGEAP